MLGKKRVAYSKPILMARNAAKGIFLAVEDKAALGVYFKGAAAKASTDEVNRFAVNDKLSLSRIEIGVLSSVPESDVRNIKLHGSV